MFPLRRRALLLQAGAALALAACRRSKRPPEPTMESSATPPPPGGHWRDLSFPPSEDAPEGQRALVLLPDDPKSAPLLIALHGRGEAGRGLEVGAGAWPRDYALDRMHRRLRSPPLTPADLEDMQSPARLAKLNASLDAALYQGLVVACPATPVLADKSVEGASAYGRFLVDTLLPRVRGELQSKADRASTGIDGVSMGGRIALFVGLSHPEVFGVVGALQPAISVQEAPLLAALAKRAMAKAPVQLRLVSSDEDPFLPAVRAASDQLRAEGVPHTLLVIPGTHGYAFNRGPGGAELLLWHERLQRGLPAP